MLIRRLEIVAFTVVLGLAVGAGIFTFVYARGYSYLTNDPAACANCHVMEAHFSAWVKSSHRAVAVCNDCHTPAGFVPKYLTKASNGFWHSFAFTTGDFPDPLRIKRDNLEIAEEACLKCHEGIVSAITAGPHMTGIAAQTPPQTEGLSCIRCHGGVGHWIR